MDRSAFVTLLVTLRHEARSGVLEVRSDGLRSFVYLLRGELVFAEEESIGESLGRMLVRQQKLTNKQYSQIIGRMTDALIDNEQLRFGEVAVELGFLTSEEVSAALADQVRWKIIRALQREECEAEFAESSSEVAPVVRNALPLEPLILEACRWIPDEQKHLTIGLVSPERLLTLREPASTVAKRYQTTPDERAFLAHLDGKKRMPELLALENPNGTDVPGLLTALVISKGIGYAKEPAKVAPPPLPPMQETKTPAAAITPTQVAGAPPAPAAAPAVHRGFVPTPQQFVPFRELAPDVKRDKDAAKEKADRALALMMQNRIGATKPRTDETSVGAAPAPAPTPRPRPTDHESRLLAEKEFQRGRMHLFQGQTTLAHSEFEKARALQPQSIEYELHALWAAFVLGVLSPDEGRSKLRVAFGAALKNDPNSAFAYYVMGEVAVLDKNESTAKRAFAHAVKLDPNHVDALRRLRMLTKK